MLMELKLSDGKIHTFEVSEIVIVLSARFICVNIAVLSISTAGRQKTSAALL